MKSEDKLKEALITEYGKVKIIKFQHSWFDNFRFEMQRIQVIFGSGLIEIEHVGSTSIMGMDAKPTIDMLAGLTSLKSNLFYDGRMSKLGYQFRPDHPVAGRLHYANIQNNVRLFNLSLCVHRKSFWYNHILFRNYLRSHPEIVQDYCKLKHYLALRHPNDTVLYTFGKNQFIKKILNLAKLV
jgi:GrpB-like predicted nucleotidyltransferase (UPF0157 family)